MIDSARRLWITAQRSRVLRAWQRFTEQRGVILAAGVAYFAFFSVFPALALAFTVFGAVASSHPAVYDSLIDTLEGALPGFIKSDENPDGFITVTLPSSTALTWTGVLAGLGLLYAGTAWLRALRGGLRAVFGVPVPPGNAVFGRIRDLGVLVVLGVLLLVSAVASTVLTLGSQWLTSVTGLDVSSWMLGVGGLLIGLAGDMAIMVVLLRGLTGVPLPRRAIRDGALVGGAALSLMTYFGAQLIHLGVRNPVFGAVVGVIGVLFWLHLIAQATLLSGAWAAVDLDPAELVPPPGEGSEPASWTTPLRRLPLGRLLPAGGARGQQSRDPGSDPPTSGDGGASGSPRAGDG